MSRNEAFMTQFQTRLSTFSSAGRAALACLALFVALAAPASAQTSETIINAGLSGAAIGGQTPTGKAVYRERPGNDRKLQVEVQDVNLPAGTTLNVLVAGQKVGTLAIDALRAGRLELETGRGQAVPVAANGTAIAVTNASGASVVAGTYAIDEARFRAARELFGREQYAAARDEWMRADPAGRDARTQFYIAYAFYREGWGRVYHDDALYKQGLEAAERAVALSPAGALAVDDAELKIHSAAELKAELQQGLETSAGDFNPLKIVRERK